LTVISVVFSELFYGSGSWLGLLLYLSIIIGLMRVSKEASLIMLPVSVFLAIDYFGRAGFVWYGIIMTCVCIFIVLSIMGNKKGK
jgi:hypothetical protein